MSSDPDSTKEVQGTELFGSTRTVVRNRHALLAPQGSVASSLPGWEHASVVVLVSPAMGARFCQLLITLEKEGLGRGNTGKTEFFVYVLEGTPSVTLDAKRNRLEAGSFIYIPPNKDIHFQGSNSRLLVFQRVYEPMMAGGSAPQPLVSHLREVKAQPVSGDAEIRRQVLLADSPAFDLAVNLLTFPPGAAMPFVETSVMEHGLMLLQGRGIFRLEDEYHPVRAGDAIWMAPYCPQWFVAMGGTPASYICYQDVNRDPL